MKTALRRHQMFIGGQWVDSTGNDVQEVKNTALGEVIASSRAWLVSSQTPGWARS